MNKFLKFTFLILFFLTVSADEGTIYTDNEICKLKEPGLDQTHPKALTNSPIFMSQNTCVERFTLDLDDPMFKNKQYIYVEADFTALPNPPPYYSMMLVQGDTALPLISYYDRGLHEKADRDDYNAYINGKTFHRIVLNANNIKKGGKRYFAVYKLLWDIGDYPSPSSHVVSYTISARVSPNFECINNCNGQGSCDAVLEQCDCYAGFFDSDCSLEARRLNPGVPQSQPVYPNKAAYYYTSFQGINLIK